MLMKHIGVFFFFIYLFLFCFFDKVLNITNTKEVMEDSDQLERQLGNFIRSAKTD